MVKKNILFVDDNENVISGIKRQLRPYRDQWELFFASSGKQALELMARQHIDLIVSDMLMPEMNGDELLIKVGEDYPATVRMILSGYADEDTLKRGLEVAHQYLSKPCTAEILREAISQVFKIQSCVQNPRIAETVGDIKKLPSLPKIYQDLNAAIADEKTTIQDIANIFSRDMSLSAKLLQLVNSPYFGMNRIISSLSDAVNLIGLRKLNSLVLSAHIEGAFPVNDPQMETTMKFLWRDSARTSELARLIALSENQLEDRPDQAYLGGLLHNMGLLIFLSRGGDKLERLLKAVKETDVPVCELETDIFGCTRSEAAAYILSLWKIPPRIIEAILLQNTPSHCDYEGVNALTAVHVATCLLKPSVMADNDRLFEVNLDIDYLKRINKYERLADWQTLAEKVIAHHASGDE
jgi:Predicted signal transduction protein